MDELRDRMAAYLAEHRVGVLSIACSAGPMATVAHYRSRGLVVDCLLPHWDEAAFHLSPGARAVLIVRDDSVSHLRWVRLTGTARLLESPDPAERFPSALDIGRDLRHIRRHAPDLYLVARISPQRLDLLDESRGWGWRETLDL